MNSIHLIRPEEMTPEHVARWTRFQQADPALDNPFLCPEFTQAVAAVRGDVEVALLEEDGEIAGFFPFQRTRWNVGRPVAGRLSEAQGMVAHRGLTWDAEQLVRGCGLAAWRFDHVLQSQAIFQPHAWTTEDAPYLDLSAGYEAYLAERRAAKSRRVASTLQKMRKFAREAPDVRLEPQTTDREVLQTLYRWKSAQYRETNATDVFAFDWMVSLLERLFDFSSEHFEPMLSVLWADGRPAAISYSLRSHRVLQGWFIGYNPEFGKYSPGLGMILQLVEAVAATGVERIEMGAGAQAFKQSLASGTTAVTKGAVTCGRMARLVHNGWRCTRHWVRNSKLQLPAAAYDRFVRPMRQKLALR